MRPLPSEEAPAGDRATAPRAPTANLKIGVERPPRPGAAARPHRAGPDVSGSDRAASDWPDADWPAADWPAADWPAADWPDSDWPAPDSLGPDWAGVDPRVGADAAAPRVTIPGEYEPVDRVLFGWHAGNWPYLRYFARVMREVAREATALVAVESADERAALREALADEGVDVSRVEFVLHELDSMWIRDYGPILARTASGYQVLDLPYHPDRERDDAFPRRFARDAGLPVTRPPLDMEGGHLQSDGKGRCIVTDDVLDRNLPRDEAYVRRILRSYFGCRVIVIVPRLYAEETGHVDVFAYVTGPGRVIVGSYRPEEDRVNARRLNRAARLLRESGFEVTRLPMPDNGRRRIFRTHTNVLVLDRSVLVPVFRRDRRHERRALRTFAAAFPDRRIVPIRADGVMGLAGALHCTAVTVPREARAVRRRRG